MPSALPPNAFDREDEGQDSQFYDQPRFVYHIDEYAVAAVTEAYRRFLPHGGDYLDLMSSWVSHFPPEIPVNRLTGLGMNEVELQQNEALTDFAVHDLNLDPHLPFPTAAFDGVVICVSAQYLTQPVAVFAEVSRVLKPASPLVGTFSNRCFPTKAVLVSLFAVGTRLRKTASIRSLRIDQDHIQGPNVPLRHSLGDERFGL